MDDVDRNEAEEAAYLIGTDDGFALATQKIDALTGGDGEYVASLGSGGRNCPDAATMIDRIVERFTALRTRAETAEAERDAVRAEPFQARVDPWLIACFGEAIARDREERNHRFLEEALELVQANGCTQHEAHQLVKRKHLRRPRKAE